MASQNDYTDPNFKPSGTSPEAAAALEKRLQEFLKQKEQARAKEPVKPLETVSIVTEPPRNLETTDTQFNILSEDTLTDTKMANLVEKTSNDTFRYVPDWKQWVKWDGKRWIKQPDRGEIETSVIATTEKLKNWAANNQRMRLFQQVQRFESNTRIKAIVERCQSLPQLRVSNEDFDNKPWLLNVANGTVNLKTGELEPHKPGDLLTQITPVTYSETAKAPSWEAFLNQIFLGDSELIAFVKRCVGYTLTGTAGDRAMFITHGTGGTGKSVFLETFKTLLGDYAAPLNPEALVKHQYERHPTDLAMLRGKRLAYAQETAEGVQLNTALVKSLTGGDTITVRKMRQDPQPMKPTFKLWLSTNHKPEIKETGNAIWDRVKYIPFRYRVPEEKKQLREVLEHKFTVLEGPGVLRWAIEGCLDYQKQGFNPPQIIQDETNAYRETMDTLEHFLSDCCEIGNATFQVTSNELYAAFLNWCKLHGEPPLTDTAFGTKLTDRGFLGKSVRKGKATQRVRLNIKLKEPDL